MYYGRCHDIERNRADGKTGADRIRNPYVWQQGVASLVFQELTDVWPDPIFVPKVAIV